MGAKLTNAQILLLERCANSRGLYSYDRHGNTFDALKRRGLIARADGWKTLYQITEAGRQALADAPEAE
jgi:hypothetical protein